MYENIMGLLIIHTLCSVTLIIMGLLITFFFRSVTLLQIDLLNKIILYQT